jgi:F0F1-type ATP synthase membrane subunit b/b'
MGELCPNYIPFIGNMSRSSKNDEKFSVMVYNVSTNLILWRQIMLTNNKKSFFAKGIAVLMALLMVLSVCLTGCGKAAEEAAKNAQDTADKAVTDAAAAQSAADAVKESLKDYLKTANAVTTQNVDDAIKAALEGYATAEELGAFVKSEDFDNLVKSLDSYITKAALEEALKDVATDAEVKALTDKLAADVAANKGNIEKALNDLKSVATDAEVEAIKTQTLENGYVIGTDDALLSAGCTIQITDFIAAVAKACKDDQAVSFQSAGNFTLGVAANSYNDGSKDADDDKDGAVQVYSDIAASVVEGGKIVASLNDAVQPKIGFNEAGEITTKTFNGTKRELKENYGMSTSPYSPDNNGDGTVKEWYVQSAAFSAYVVGKTGAEVKGLETQFVNGHDISKDDALLNAGCTIQITGIKAVVGKSVDNAR